MEMDHAKQLGEEKVSRLLLKFSIPSIIAMLVNALYNVIDRIFIGNSAGSLGIAGITLGFPIMMVTMSFGMLIGVGATALVSIRLGEQRRDDAQKIVGNAFLLLLCISIISTIAGLIFLDPLLRAFGADDIVLPYARDFVSIILLGTTFMSIGFGMNNFIRAEGKPKTAMVTMITGTVLNAIFAPIFIFVFHWGVKGAATATVLAQSITGIWIFTHFLTGKSMLRIQLKYMKIDWKIVGGILAIGLAPFLMNIAQSLLSVIMNLSLVKYGGNVAVSGMGLILSVLMLIMMPIIGISTGAQPLIGFNYGARKFDRVKEALKLAVISATVFVTIGYAFLMVFSRQIMSLFNRSDLALIEFGTYAMRIYLICLPIVGFQIVSSNYFQAVGKPKQAMILSLSRQVLILIPALLILPSFFQLFGVLIAGPIADFLSSGITAVCLYIELKNLDRKHRENTVAPAPVPGEAPAVEPANIGIPEGNSPDTGLS